MARRFKHSQYPKIFKPLYPNNLTLSLKKQHVIMIAILFERVFMESVLNFLTNINVIFTLLGYLIGGIPFGYALMKIFYGMDITKIGSGGIGATNVLRALQSKGVSNAKQMAL
ncbi:glycerol-3-phosphate acyltransferase, partial [Helicobacter pylori]